MPQFCNCVQSWEAEGKQVSRLAKYTYGAFEYHEVVTTKDKLCIHCRHHTVFAKIHPEVLTNQIFAEQQLRRRDILPAISEENGWIEEYSKGRVTYRKKKTIGG